MKLPQIAMAATMVGALSMVGAARPQQQRQPPPPPQQQQQHAVPRSQAPSHQPKANQGRLPPPPIAQRGRATPAPQAERLPSGRSDSTPHVNHDQWYGRAPMTDRRFRLAQPYAHGRFTAVGPRYRYPVARIDQRLHRFWLPSGAYFEVASWDWALAANWCWTCGDTFVLYDDPDHAGWYLLYDVDTGVYVHCTYLGQ